MSRPLKQPSLRRKLLLGILLPVCLFIGIDGWLLYQQTLDSVNIAYDRSLLASAKSIGETLTVRKENGKAQLKANVVYAALEPFEADNRSQLYYKVTGFEDELVSGYPDIPVWRGQIPQRANYAALVHFYDAVYQQAPVRIAVLLQPVVSEDGFGMATIQVAETLQLRNTMARGILISTLWRQWVLIVLIVTVIFWVVQRATSPIRQLSFQLQNRHTNDLSPIEPDKATPRELLPLINATNQVMKRLSDLIAHQKRFVRDTAHQLRTPLAVLKTQVQSALRGDVAEKQALSEINETVNDATRLANQMLDLAKVEQLRLQAQFNAVDWAPILRDMALQLAPLIAQKHLDFEIRTEPCVVFAHEWMLRELSRNLLHNAINHSPQHGRLNIRLTSHSGLAQLHILDEGGGIHDELRKRLFQPFTKDQSAPHINTTHQGAGLGLAICQEIVLTLNGHIDLVNRMDEKNPTHCVGLDTHVRIKLA